MKRYDGSKVMDDFIEVIKSIQMVQGTASTLVLQGAILDLAARLDKLTERVGELELASPCPLLKSICEDWEYDAKPSPDKQEMVERYTVRICEEASVKHPNKLVEALVDFRKDILRQFAEEVRRG